MRGMALFMKKKPICKRIAAAEMISVLLSLADGIRWRIHHISGIKRRSTFDSCVATTVVIATATR